MTKSILIVDDERSTLEMIEEAFRQTTKYEIDTAISIKQFKEKIEKNLYDVIVLDLNIGADNGLELIPDIKKSYSKKAKLILCTGMIEGENKIKEIIKSGIDHYIPKPLSIPDMVKKISSVVENNNYIKKNMFSGNNFVSKRKIEYVVIKNGTKENAIAIKKTDPYGKEYTIKKIKKENYSNKEHSFEDVFENNEYVYLIS